MAVSKKKRRKAQPKPVWERGYRGHVYWLGKAKLGKVTLHQEKDAPQKYTWEAAGRVGAAESLAAARRAVEFAVAITDKQLTLFD